MKAKGLLSTAFFIMGFTTGLLIGGLLSDPIVVSDLVARGWIAAVGSIIGVTLIFIFRSKNNI